MMSGFPKFVNNLQSKSMCFMFFFKGAGVVGGNVLTSQRCCDVVLKAFGVCSASQGCMNNITFGDETLGYYETGSEQNICHLK